MVIQPATMVNNGEIYGFLIGIESNRYIYIIIYIEIRAFF